jgi:hypothetical protein
MTKKSHDLRKSGHEPKKKTLSPRQSTAVSAPQQPRFADIQVLLDNLVPPSDTNIEGAPHKRFWRNAPTDTRDGFVNWDTAKWGQPGRLITPGDPNRSNLYLALGGIKPFDGSEQNQMPDVNADFNATLATKDQLKIVAIWIKNGAPG